MAFRPYGLGSGFEADDGASLLLTFVGCRQRAPSMDGYAERSHANPVPVGISVFAPRMSILHCEISRR